MSKPTKKSLASPLGRYDLPGFGLPLNYSPHAEYSSFDYKDGKPMTNIIPAVGEWGPLFANALESDSQLKLVTLRELTMMQFMNQLTDKPGWDIKIFDQTIVAKWKAEALAAPNTDMTERMFTYCIEELRYKSKIFQETGIITTYNGDVVKSDTAIPSSVKDALRTATAPLEDVSEKNRDWHPGSDGKVLDLVHPSLFPVVYGRTRILTSSTIDLDDCIKRCGEGETLSVPSREEAQTRTSWDISVRDPYSCKFQWLPCEVEFDGDTVKIASYINNLHPQIHKPVYDVIEKIIGLTIPLWNHTLTGLTAFRSSIQRIHYSKCEYDPDPESLPEEEQPQQLPNESDDDYWDRRQDWAQTLRRVVRPEPDDFKPPQDKKKFDLKGEFGDKGLQIIVKLANIHLTPEKPEYEGGTWHVEGQMNEHICASAIYYYDSSNITESYLSFRQRSSTEDAGAVSYEQEHHDWLSEVFGCEQDEPAIQYVGDIISKEGRLLTFPNVLQHRVSPFTLLDKAEPGHRKILALFLVDPHIRIISSANVPCQQKEWWAQELQVDGALPRLPNEMIKEVVDNVEDFPIGLDEAKELRVELMEERKAFVGRHNEELESVTFSLCEH